MDPMTMMMLGSFAMQAMGQWQQGQQTADALSYNEDVANIRADQILKDTAFKMDIERRANERLRGKQIATIGKTGTMMAGSNLDILADQALIDELNMMAIKYTGDTAALNQRTQGALYGKQAGLQTQAGGIKSIATLAGGLGNIFAMNKKKELVTSGGGISPTAPDVYNWEPGTY